MDYINSESVLPASHYEYVFPENQASIAEDTKNRAHRAMDELEGWCAKQKASILIDLILMLKPETVVEIGVFGGKSLVPMAYALRENGRGRVYGIDPWDSGESAEGMDGINHEYWSQVDHEGILRGLQEKILKFGLSNQIQLIRQTSEDAEPIENIDILHIDGNHSEQASYIDVIKWVPLVKKGGLIIFDDVNWSTTKMATQWLDQNCIKFSEFSGDNIWGIWVKP